VSAAKSHGLGKLPYAIRDDRHPAVPGMGDRYPAVPGRGPGAWDPSYPLRPPLHQSTTLGSSRKRSWSTVSSPSISTLARTRLALSGGHPAVMAMASLSSMAITRTPLPGLQPSLQLRRSRASPAVISCTAAPPVKRLQCAGDSEGIGKRVGGVLLPLFAAALIGERLPADRILGLKFERMGCLENRDLCFINEFASLLRVCAFESTLL
jgi:hypothetical protein